MMRISATMLAVFVVSALNVRAVAAPLSSAQQLSLQAWLASHKNYRVATESDCECLDDLDMMRKLGPWTIPIPDYAPYVTVGDFRHNGQSGFVVIVVEQAIVPAKDGMLLIFDGPFAKTTKQPSYSVKVDPIIGHGIVINKDGAPVYGAFYSEGCIYQPWKHTYREDCGGY